MKTIWQSMIMCRHYKVYVHKLEGVLAAIGQVEVKVCKQELLIHEQGQWCHNLSRVDNIWRWGWDQDQLTISRRVGQQSEFDTLACFTQLGPSVMPYHCGQDQYHAAIALDGNQLHLTWDIKGPQKDEVLDYCYYTSRRNPI